MGTNEIMRNLTKVEIDKLLIDKEIDPFLFH